MGNGNFMLDGIVMQGPGVKEPHPEMIAKQWEQRFEVAKGRNVKVGYWILHNGTRISYNFNTGRYKKWRAPKLAVIGKNMPSHKQITRLRHNLKRHKDDAKTILQLTDPVALMKSRGYTKQRSTRGRYSK